MSVTGKSLLFTSLLTQGLPLPPHRHFDGIDISPVLFDGAEQAHSSLFHPNSGGYGPSGKEGEEEEERGAVEKCLVHT